MAHIVCVGINSVKSEFTLNGIDDMTCAKRCGQDVSPWGTATPTFLFASVL
jgi:hypothetical protein